MKKQAKKDVRDRSRKIGEEKEKMKNKRVSSEHDRTDLSVINNTNAECIYRIQPS